MKASRLITLLAALAILAGCGGSQTVPQNATTLAKAHQSGKSWMLPEAKNEDLLYVSSSSDYAVGVYSYKTHKQLGLLSGFKDPRGQCVDSAGDVWITSGQKVVEYAHGGSKALKIFTIIHGITALGCSVAPNGDLAVSTYVRHRRHYDWSVVVFKDGRRGQDEYRTPFRCKHIRSPGYDANGNLYVEAYYVYQNSYGSYESKSEICELPSGAKHLRVVSFKAPKREIPSNAAVMWDGKFMVFAEPYGRLYLTEELPNGDVKPTTFSDLKDTHCGSNGTSLQNFFLVGNKNPPLTEQANAVVAPNLEHSCGAEFDGWSYPDGGTQRWAINVWSAGTSVSLAQ
jgi:hypothetical protein